jgi:hypothetical protein
MRDWFERLTGFREGDYRETRARLKVENGRLYSLVNKASYVVGAFDLVSLNDLRRRAGAAGKRGGGLRAQIVAGDVRQMHRMPENAGALFQAASQFNCLEMVSPAVTPEQGVTRYQYDHTQGPACAIAAGAATIYRNYFVPVGGSYGQTVDRQLDGLAELGETLRQALAQPKDGLWTMRNGYAFCTRQGLVAITGHLDTLNSEQLDFLRGKLSVGIHQDVEATEAEPENRPLLSQVFCSALPISYTAIEASRWEQFARLILEAAYEATLWAAVLNARRGASRTVFLTLLGGGAFGNPEAWIVAAMKRALRIVADYDLDVKLVSYGAPSPAVRRLAEEFP